MQYRTLSQTQLQVSILGFGASPLGDVFGATDPMDGMAAVHLAIDHGVNFFDVSPFYGSTLAEVRLGEALAGRRKDVVLATKCGRYGLDVFDFSAGRVVQSLEESLRRLHTDYVDLLQAHDVEFGNLEQIVHETLPAMRRLQQEGKARFIGISGYPLEMLRGIAEAAPLDTILSYCHYNLMADDLDTDLMPFAERRGIGVINASALHMGILTDGGPPDWHPAPQEVHEAGRRAAKFCRDHGKDLSEIALQFCLDYPRVASTLVGISGTDQVVKNLRALAAPRDRELEAEVRAILAPAFNVVWTSGRPENHAPARSCPQKS